MMKKKLLIRDCTLRDGQQSMLATRMTQKQVDRLLPYFKEACFPYMEVWGGAVPDSTMRFLNENPWDRLEKIKAGLDPKTKLTALSRGRNLFGYDPYPDHVIEGFCQNSIKSGIDVMRTFDALNDINNMTATIKFVKKHGGIADAAICYSTDPTFTFKDKLGAFFKGQKLPQKVYTDEYFIQKALEIASHKPDMISIKDMAGLIDPWAAKKIIKGLKQEIKDIPIDLHTHCTPGYGTACLLLAILEGVDIVDTDLIEMAGGPANPCFEVIYLFAKKLGIEIDVNISVLAKLNQEIKVVRDELKAFDNSPVRPRHFDLTKDKLPKEVELMFDGAIEAAGKDDIGKALELCQKIDAHFNFEAPNKAVQEAQVPGGMYSNMLSQLSQLKLSHLFNDVLKVIPKVRADAGMIPLVTPTSQIVGSQAVNCVINVSKGKPFYDMTTNQFRALVQGSYGKTPIEIDPQFRKQITGEAKEIAYDVKKHQSPANPLLPEYGENIKLAKDEKEYLLLELFPMVANGFLKGKRKAENDLVLQAAHEAEWAKINEANSKILQGLELNYFE